MRVAVISDIHGDLDSLRQRAHRDRSAGHRPDLVPGRHRRARRDRAGRGRRPRPRSLRTRARRQPRPLGHWPALAQHAATAPPTRAAAMAAPCALQRAARMARSAARPGSGSRHRALARQRPGPNHRLDLKPARRGGSSRPPASPDRARRAHPPTVDRREQRHEDRVRRAPRQPRPRRRPSRSAQPRCRAPRAQMARA